MGIGVWCGVFVCDLCWYYLVYYYGFSLFDWCDFGFVCVGYYEMWWLFIVDCVYGWLYCVLVCVDIVNVLCLIIVWEVICCFIVVSYDYWWSFSFWMVWWKVCFSGRMCW